MLRCGWIYLLKAEGRSLYKVGRSSSPNARLASIQKDWWKVRRIKVRRIYHAWHWNQYQAEARLHRYLQAERIDPSVKFGGRCNGDSEWFELSKWKAVLVQERIFNGGLSQLEFSIYCVAFPLAALAIAVLLLIT
jgi:hypothetical protein